MGFDYASEGAYFVTICTHQRRKRFGHIADGHMQLNTAGEMVDRALQELSSKFPGVDLASHVVIPNHVHGLVVFRHPTHANREATQGLPYEGDRPTLSTVVGWFKTMSTNWYMHGVRDAGWPPFDRVLWQRSFHDRIVRNDPEMDRIWTYISDNPALWEDDTFYS